METIMKSNLATQQSIAATMLHDLGIPAHLIGYRQLRLALPYFAQNDSISLTKELYPYIAKHFREDPRAVERDIRFAILHGWMRGERVLWNSVFLDCDKVPSNKLFIATLAEYLN